MASPTLRASNVWPIDGGDDILQITGQGGAVLGGITAGGSGFGALAGGGIPAGSTGDMQFNNNGAFSNAQSINAGCTFALSGDGNLVLVAPGILRLSSATKQVIIEAGGSDGLSLVSGAGDFSIESNQNISIFSDNASITLEADSGFIGFTASSISLIGQPNMASLQVFASNAAAISGGLGAGDLYRTGADPDPVCVVH